MPEVERTPNGPVRGARFGGLLEGRVGDRLALERAVRKLREEGPIEPTLEVEGMRFALYLSDEPISADRADPQRMQAFLEGLRELVEAVDKSAALESTLRCTEFYADEVVETHIGIEDDQIAPVSRVRDRAVGDELTTVQEYGSQPLLNERPRRVLLAVAVALLLAFVAWQARVLDRAFGVPAEDLHTLAGPFGELVDMTIEPGFGAYVVQLQRGPDYPMTGADVTRLEGAAQSPLERAAVAALADGRPVEARVLDTEGEVLTRGLIGTKGLILEGNFISQLSLPARFGAATIELGLPLGDSSIGGLR